MVGRASLHCEVKQQTTTDDHTKSDTWMMYVVVRLCRHKCTRLLETQLNKVSKAERVLACEAGGGVHCPSPPFSSDKTLPILDAKDRAVKLPRLERQE